MPASGVGGGGPEQFDDLSRLGAVLGGAALALWGQVCNSIHFSFEHIMHHVWFVRRHLIHG